MRFRGSPLWNLLKRVRFLRSALHLGIESRRAFHEDMECSRAEVNRDFEEAEDPWRYKSDPAEIDRFARQLGMLRDVAPRFGVALEIGCAEGEFTEQLLAFCDQLFVLDIAPLALERTRARLGTDERIRLRRFDLRNDDLVGPFDLIVVAGVLEYFSARSTLRAVRSKLVNALLPGAYLLVETTKGLPLVEDAPWGRWLPRGRRINEFIGQHGDLRLVAQESTEQFAISMFRKAV